MFAADQTSAIRLLGINSRAWALRRVRVRSAAYRLLARSIATVSDRGAGSVLASCASILCSRARVSAPTLAGLVRFPDCVVRNRMRFVAAIDNDTLSIEWDVYYAPDDHRPD